MQLTNKHFRPAFTGAPQYARTTELEEQERECYYEVCWKGTVRPALCSHVLQESRTYFCFLGRGRQGGGRMQLRAAAWEQSQHERLMEGGKEGTGEERVREKGR